MTYGKDKKKIFLTFISPLLTLLYFTTFFIFWQPLHKIISNFYACIDIKLSIFLNNLFIILLFNIFFSIKLILKNSIIAVIA